MALNCGGGKQQQTGFNAFVVVEQIEKNGKKKGRDLLGGVG
jgi:hypothetical protein